MKKVETDENKKSNGNAVSAVSAGAGAIDDVRARDIKEFGYMKLVNGNLIKLNWTLNERRKKNQLMPLKLFTIKCVDELIEVI